MKKVYPFWIILGLALMLTGCFSSPPEQAKEVKAPPLQEEPAAEVGVEESELQKPVDPVVEPIQASMEQAAPTFTAPVPPPEPAQVAPAKPSTPSATNQLTVEQIQAKYTKELTALQGHYSGRLQGLYQGAVADAKSSSESKTAIYSKYAKQGSAFEEESQAKVNQVLQQMKQELKAHHYPTQSVDGLRSSYYAELDKAKNRALGEVKKVLGM